VNGLRKEITGHRLKLNGQMGPNAVTLRPWNSVVLKLFRETSSGPQLVDTSLLGTAIANQLGLATQSTPKINFRIKTVKVWAVATAALAAPPEVKLNISSLIPNVADNGGLATGGEYPVLSILDDVGTLSEAARVGYAYPLAMQQMTTSSDAGYTLFRIESNTDTQMHVEILWCLTDLAIPTSGAGAPVEDEA